MKKLLFSMVAVLMIASCSKDESEKYELSYNSLVGKTLYGLYSDTDESLLIISIMKLNFLADCINLSCGESEFNEVFNGTEEVRYHCSDEDFSAKVSNIDGSKFNYTIEYEEDEDNETVTFEIIKYDESGLILQYTEDNKTFRDTLITKKTLSSKLETLKKEHIK